MTRHTLEADARLASATDHGISGKPFVSLAVSGIFVVCMWLALPILAGSSYQRPDWLLWWGAVAIIGGLAGILGTWFAKSRRARGFAALPQRRREAALRYLLLRAENDVAALERVLRRSDGS